MLSLGQKMTKAYNLSIDLYNLDPEQEYMPERTHAWIDGLVHKHYETIVSGRTSLTNTINFDIEKFEQSVDEDITEMEAALKTLK